MPDLGVRAGAGPGQEAEGGVGERVASVWEDPGRNGRKRRARPARGGPLSLPLAHPQLSAACFSHCVRSVAGVSEPGRLRLCDAPCFPTAPVPDTLYTLRCQPAELNRRVGAVGRYMNAHEEAR